MRAFALVDRETISDERDPAVETDTIRLHRLVREVAASRLNEDGLAKIRAALIGIVATAYPEGVLHDLDSWPRARRLNALALGLVGANVLLPPEGEVIAAELMNMLATYHERTLADYVLADQLYQRALEISEKTLGPEHESTATYLDNIGTLRCAHDNFAEARPYLERALAIREKVLGPDDLKTGSSLTHLAIVLSQLDDPAAEALHRRALKNAEQVLGPDHPKTGIRLSNLAIFLLRQGNMNESRDIFQKTLKIDEMVYGINHPEAAVDLYNISSIFLEEGNFVEIRPFIVR